MNLGKLFSAAAILAFAAHASAATVSLTFTGVDPGESESVSFLGGSNLSTSAGSMDWSVGSPNGVPQLIPGGTLSSYCIEGTQSISKGNTVTYTVLGPGEGAYNSVFTNSNLVTAFFNQYYTTVLGSASSAQNEYNAAFQLAIWELVYDGTGDKPLSGDRNDSRWFTTGNFQIDHSSFGFDWQHTNIGPTGVDYSGAEVNLAETWLDGFNSSTTGSWVVFQLTNSQKQDQVFAVQEAGAPAPAPLPAALPAGLGLIGSLAAFRKFRLRKQA